jgi:branched-chain amino acid transport system ATP-binding protein
LIGPNGAGKTTIFNMVTGFLKPDGGEVVFRKKSLIGKKPNHIVNSGISRTFQLVKPFKDLSLYDNLRVACYSKRFSARNPGRENAQRKILENAQRVGLPEDLSMPASNLSQGDLRLLDIGRSLIPEPEMLLLDEPLSGLSSIETRKVLNLVMDLNEEGFTILIIEHKLKELMKIAKRIIVIDFGEKIAEGTPHEIVNNPDVIKAYLGKKKNVAA